MRVTLWWSHHVCNADILLGLLRPFNIIALFNVKHVLNCDVKIGYLFLIVNGISCAPFSAACPPWLLSVSIHLGASIIVWD